MKILNELKILEIQWLEGSVECLVFVSGLEVLDACESTTNSDSCEFVHLCSLHTVSLWALAKDEHIYLQYRLL